MGAATSPEPVPPAAATVTAPPKKRAVLRYILIGVGSVLALAVMGFLFYNTSVHTTNDHLAAARSADSKMQRDHHSIDDKMASTFHDLDKQTCSCDPIKARDAVNQVVHDLDAARALNAKDKGLVETADNELQDRFPFGMFSGSQLDAEHDRLDADSKALDDEIYEIDVLSKQLGVISDYFTMLSQLPPLTKDLQANDLASAERDYLPASGTLDKMVVDARDAPETPPKMNEYVGLIRQEMNDLKDVIDSAKAHYADGLLRAFERLATDTKAESTFDSKALQQQYEDLGKRLDEKVKKHFKPVTPTV